MPLRTHVIVYAVVNTVLVALWAATRERDTSIRDEGFGLLWPFWIMLLWGVVLIAQSLYVLRQPLLRRARRRRRARVKAPVRSLGPLYVRRRATSRIAFNTTRTSSSRSAARARPDRLLVFALQNRERLRERVGLRP